MDRSDGGQTDCVTREDVVSDTKHPSTQDSPVAVSGVHVEELRLLRPESNGATATNLSVQCDRSAVAIVPPGGCTQGNTDIHLHSREESRNSGENQFQSALFGKHFDRQGKSSNDHRIHDGEKSFERSLCGEQSSQPFKSQGDTITSHFRMTQSHTSETFECTVCGKSIQRKCNFARHLRLHTDKKQFDCTICGKHFEKKYRLTEHFVIHTSEKPFKCTVCGTGFKRKQNLTTHLRLHTGEKPYECAICGKHFAHKTNLTSHLGIHTGEKPFECTVCGMKFRQRGTLSAHHRVHTGEKPFECSVCGQSFNQGRTLTKHLRIHIEDPAGT